VEEAFGLGDVGDEEVLVALAAGDFAELQGVEADDAGEHLEEFEEAEAGGVAAADVKDLAGGGVAVDVGGVVEGDEVVGVEDVADLLAGAGDGELGQGLAGIGGGALLDGFLAEPADPALVEGGELAAAVDGGVAEDDGLEPEDAGPVAGVLVGGALRAAVGGGEVEGEGFVEAGGEVGEVVAGGELLVAEVLKVAVNLVGGAVGDEGVGGEGAGGLEDVKGAEDVGLEVAAGLGERGGHGDLAADVADEVEGGVAAVESRDGVGIGEVELDEGELAGAGLGLKPGEIRDGAVAEEGVGDDDLLAAIEVIGREIGTKEAAAARNQYFHRCGSVNW